MERLLQEPGRGLRGAGGAVVMEAGPTGPTANAGRVWGPASAVGLGLA